MTPHNIRDTAFRPSYARALRYRGFLWLWLSQLVSQSGDYIFEVAVIWLVLTTSGSVLDVGLVVAASVVPLVVTSPLLGVYVDRLDLRKLLIASNLAQGLTMVLIVVMFSSRAPYLFPLLVTALLFLFTGQTAVRLAIRAAVPRLMATQDLGPANALMYLTGSANQIIGYGVGGVVVLFLGALPAIGYDALTFFVATLLVTMVAAGSLAIGSAEAMSQSQSPVRAYREALKYVRSQRWLLEIVLLALIINFFIGGLNTLAAPYVQVDLKGGPTEFGFFLTAYAVGGAIGAIAIGRLDFRARAGLIDLLSMLVMGGSIAGLGLVHLLPMAFAVGGVIGFSLSAGNVVVGSMTQARVPKPIIGRVSSTTTLTAAAAPVGAVLLGYLGSSIPISAALLIAGIAILSWSLVGLGLFGGLRHAAY